MKKTRSSLAGLPQLLQNEIFESIKEADRGEFITYEQVQKEISDMLKIKRERKRSS